MSGERSHENCSARRWTSSGDASRDITVADLGGGGGSREGRHSFVEAHFPEIFSIRPEILLFCNPLKQASKVILNSQFQ